MTLWPQHLILVGPMGAGKSSVGRSAASFLRLPFSDTDQMVENACRMSIARVFAEKGETAFRMAETLALHRLLSIPTSVIATGGGAVTREENWEYLISSGLVVWLRVSPEESLRRTEGDTNRPLLLQGDRLDRLRELQQQRESWYRRAHRTIEADHRSVPDVTREVVALYEEWRNSLDQNAKVPV